MQWTQEYFHNISIQQNTTTTEELPIEPTPTRTMITGTTTARYCTDDKFEHNGYGRCRYKDCGDGSYNKYHHGSDYNCYTYYNN